MAMSIQLFVMKKKLISVRNFSRQGSSTLVGEDSGEQRFACLATNQPVQDTTYNFRTDRFETVFNTLNLDGMRPSRIDSGIQLIQDHRQFSIDYIFGITRDWVIRGGELLANFDFSTDDTKQGVITDIVNGIIRNFSISFIIHERTLTEEDEDGTRHYTIDDWEPLEVSIVTVGADAEATRRSLLSTIINREDKPMSRKKKGNKAQNRNGGASTEANENTGSTEATGSTESNESDNSNDNAGSTETETNENNGSTDSGESNGSTETNENAGSTDSGETNESETHRSGPNGQNNNASPNTASRFLAAAVRLGGSPEEATRAFDNNEPYDSFVDGLITRGTPPMTGKDVKNIEDQSKKFIRGASEALLGMYLPQHYEISKGNEYRGMSLVDLADEALQMQGVNTRGMSKQDRVERSLHTTSDFVRLMELIVNTTVTDNFREVDNTFMAVGNQSTNQDFRRKNTIRLGDLPDLLRVNEHGEFKRGTLTESGEGYSLATFGRIIGFTRQLIINDQTGELLRLLAQNARQVARLQGDVFWGAFLGWDFERGVARPSLLEDGNPVFYAARRNLSDGADSVLSVDALRDIRKRGRLMKTQDGKIRAPVEFNTLVVPPELESDAEKLTQLTFNPSVVADAIPDFIRSMTVIVEPRLQDLPDGETAWFCVDSTMPGIDYANLAGEEQIFTDQRVGFDIDGIEFKVRTDFGAGWTEATGAHKAVGA